MRHFLALMLLCFAALPARAQVTEFRLENGLQVVVIEDHRAPVVTHMVWYRVGSADDPPGKSGLSHFLEHLMFDGTDRLAPGEFSRIVTRNGGQGNAFTSFDYTGYFQRVAADRLPLMMELEADRMANLVIDRATVAEERAVVLEERGLRVDANPGAIISERERAALFLHHPYRIPIIGWRHEIEGLTADDAQAFYRRHYAPDNAILIVAGDVTPDAVRALAREHYGPIPAAGVTPRARVQEPPHIAARRVTYADARVTQPSVSRGYLAPSRRSGAQAEAAALSLFTRLLGRGPTSHLYRTLVVEEGVAVAAGAGYSPLGLGPSALSVYAVPAQGVGLEEIEARLDAALESFLATPVPAGDLERAKAALRAELIYARDNVQSRASRYGRALTSGLSVADVQAWPDALLAVTVEDVMAAGQEVLTPESSVTGILKGTGGQGG